MIRAAAPFAASVSVLRTPFGLARRQWTFGRHIITESNHHRRQGINGVGNQGQREPDLRMLNPVDENFSRTSSPMALGVIRMLEPNPA